MEKHSAIRPLFYRLNETEAGLGQIRKADYLQLVREDLQRLLATRYTGKKLKEKNITTFGIPSVVGFSNDSQGEKAQLERYIKEAIEEYEPRLRSVMVEIVDIDDWRRDVCMVSATIYFNEEEERFSFDYHLH